MKPLLFNGTVFDYTGVAKSHRFLLKELIKKGLQVEILDSYRERFDPEGIFKKVTRIDVESDFVQALTYNPDFWFNVKVNADRIGILVHEGNKIPESWADKINLSCSEVFVPSKATRNLFYNGGVRVPIRIVPWGVEDRFEPGLKPLELIEEKKKAHNIKFLFLNVNSWSGREDDRKGLIYLVKAFAEEFKETENVGLFIQATPVFEPVDVYAELKKLKLPKDKAPIIVSQVPISEENLPRLYASANAFVNPTRGESFGLTIIEAMACGLPVILMKNKEAGYMDFASDVAVFFKNSGYGPVDNRFFHPENRMPIPDVEDLKAKMREVFENFEKYKDKSLKISKKIRKEYSWEKSAEKFLKFYEKI